MITSQQFKDSASLLGLEVSVIKAVAEVESGGSGFLSTGEPVILFEPHQFYRELKKRGITPEAHMNDSTRDILYKKWGEQAYGPASHQHERLERACQINREAALCAASWGKFQIMGYHYRACGCATLQDFINAMYKDEAEHLRLFCNFLQSQGLVPALKAKDWRKFAFRYNGAGYEKNNYHKRLNTCYLKYKQQA
jgi:hypothetical protein